MRNSILCAIALLLTISVTAQDKLLTMEQAIMHGNTSLAPEKVNQLTWIKGSNQYSFVEKESLKAKSIDSDLTQEITTIENLNKKLVVLGENELKAFPKITWVNQSSFDFKRAEQSYNYNFPSRKLTKVNSNELPKGSASKDVHPLTKNIAYTIDNNLYLIKSGEHEQITKDADKGIVNGQVVHRFEFGISKGIFWSPDGSQLAYYRKDETMVTDYPVMDMTTMPATATTVKYPFAGNASHHVTLGVYNLQTEKTVWMKTGEPKEQYLTNIAWSPDGKTVYIVILNRDQNHFKMNSYNAGTGDFIKTLFEEKEEKYAQPLHAMKFIPSKDDQFIWQSRRDGWSHLYLYNTDGKLISQLTKGEWEVAEFKGVDKKGEYVYFTATKESPVNRDLYRVDIVTSKQTRLTKGDGTHSVTLNSDFSAFIDDFSSTEIPRKVSVKSSDGKKSKLLLTAENPLREYKQGELGIFTIKANDGSDLYCRIFRPANFDARNKYPAVVYLYGGPGVQLIKNKWLGGANLWYHYLTQRGYIVFTIENRGTPFRGKEFEQVTFRNLGKVEMEDQMKGVEYLKSLRYVDSEKMGVHGWSYGGYMTTNMMTRNPGAFKVGVGGGPVIDWKMYEVMYTERFMDTPKSNPEGYKETSLFQYIENLKGKLLLIHGTDDDVVVWQHSLDYIKESVNKGVQIDYFVYPGHPHNVRGKDRVHLMQKVTDYLFEALEQ